MLTIINVATGARKKGIMAPVAIGDVVALEALFAGPISGASMNRIQRGPWDRVGDCGGGGIVDLSCRAHHRRLLGYRLLPRLAREEVQHIMSLKQVLFVCIENSCRSQMAEAFGRMHGADAIEFHSSGSRPSGRVNERAIMFMRERNYDLSTHTSKALNEIPDVEYDYAITMGCGDECPMVRARHREDWGIPDPKHANDEEFRRIRELIERKVLELKAQLSKVDA